MTGAHLPLGAGAEFDMVRRLLARWGGAAEGIGDDAALLTVPAGHRLAVSTDVAVENIHFRREWITPTEIGYRSAAAALSDLAAMAAMPLGMTIALTLPHAWRASAEAIADGIAQVARGTDTPIVGGDLSDGSELSLAITVFGSVAHPLTRGGAQEGDTVWITGLLGGPALAVAAFNRGDAVRAEHRARFAHPFPRLAEARWLARQGATAAIDCSDGVAADLGHIAAASHAHITLDLDLLPLVSGATPLDAARSGEEYELIVTAPATLDAAGFQRLFSVPITAVGRVVRAPVEAPIVETWSNGALVPLPRGHDHFEG